MARRQLRGYVERARAGGRLSWLLVALLLAGLVAGCAKPAGSRVPVPSRPAAGREEAGAAAPQGNGAATATEQPATPATPSATPSPTASPTLRPTRTPEPAPTFTPSPTPTQAPPALVPPGDGAALALSLQLLTAVDTHITSGDVAQTDGEDVYCFGSLDRTVYAYGAGGQLRWKARMTGPVYAVAALPDGRVAAGDDSGTVALFDSKGARLWSHGLGTRVTSLSGALDGGVLAGGWDERLTLLALAPGEDRVAWQVEVGSRVTAVAALPGLAVVSGAAGEIRGLDPGGAAVWSYQAGAPVTRLTAGRVRDEAGGEEELILAGVQDGRLIVLGRDGRERRQVRLGEGSPVWSAAQIEAGEAHTIVAATGGGSPTLAVLSADGGWVWRLALPAPAGAVAARDLDGDGTAEIVVGLADGRVQAYDRRGGLRASLQAGLPVWNVLPGRSGGGAEGLVLADLNAWRLVAGAGAAAEPRFRVPPLAAAGVTPLPEGAIPAAESGGGRPGAVLVFLGDVVPGRSIEQQVERYGPAYPWAGLEQLLSDADLAMANLECVLSTQGTALSKPYVIRAHPEAVGTLVEGGLDLVTLANNHTLDYGPEALGDTLFVVERAGIAVVGAGRTEEAARRPAVFELSGVRVAVLAYAGGYWRGSADMPDSELVAWSDAGRVAADVRAVRDRADAVVVVLHAGREYARTPGETQVSVAHAAIDAGADLVVGHHPHVTQTVERYRGGLIVYSLGNALFDIQKQAALEGDLLRVLVTRDGLAQAELWPFWIDGDIQPRLLDDGKGAPRMEVVYP